MRYLSEVDLCWSLDVIAGQIQLVPTSVEKNPVDEGWIPTYLMPGYGCDRQQKMRQQVQHVLLKLMHVNFNASTH